METPQDHPDPTRGSADPAPAPAPAGRPVPGWYDDPEAPGRPRWWDGERWAAPAAPPPVAGVHGHGVGYGARPGSLDLVQEHVAGRRVRLAVWAGLVGYALNVLVGVVTIDYMSEEFERMFEAIERGGVYEPSTAVPMESSLVIANAVSLVALPLVIVPGILFVIWFHRSITNAAHLGLPQKLAPVWGILGFIVPIVNYWFPYWSGRDLFPAGHGGRKVVARWWAAWIGAQVTSMVATILGLVGAFSTAYTGVAWVFAGFSVGLYLLAAVFVRQLVEGAGRTHREIAEGAGVVAPGYDVQAPARAPVVDPWARANDAGPPDPWARP